MILVLRSGAAQAARLNGASSLILLALQASKIRVHQRAVS